MKRLWLLPIFSGLFLYILADICICLSCFDLSNLAFCASHITIFVCGAIIAVIPLIRLRSSLMKQFLSILALQVVFWLFLILDAQLGITRSFVSFHEDNYAGGLMLVLFWMFIFSICVIGFIGTAIMKAIKRIFLK